MKKAIAIVGVVAASLCGCAQSEAPQELLSTAQTCSEFEAVLALENEDVVSQGTADQLGEQMSLLAEKASTVVKKDIQLTADMSNGVYGLSGELDEEISEKYDAALARLGRVCDIDWLKGF